MALFKKNASGIDAAHVKGNTVGTSNEVSFSVLDKARMEADGESTEIGGGQAGKRLGRISLFTLPSAKKPAATPKREEGLHLTSGEFIAASGESSMAAEALAAVVTAGEDALPVGSIEAQPGTGKAPAIKVSAPALPTGKVASSAIPAVKAPASAVAAPKPVSGEAALAGQSAPKSWNIDEEVSRRKKKRRRRRTAGIVAGVVVCVALVGAGAFLVNRATKEHNEHVVGVQGAIQSIIKADETVMALDGLVTNPLEEESLGKIEEVRGLLPAARTRLEAAKRAAGEEAADMNSSRDKEAATNTMDAAEARIRMIDAGETILAQASDALKANAELEKAWEKLIAADDALKLSSSMVSKVSDEADLAGSRDKANEAVVALTEALSHIENAQALVPQVDLSAFADYASKRMECAATAVASTEALIAEDTTLAQEENDVYNKADAEAVEMARGLPAEPTQPVSAAYEQAVAEAVSAYTDARTQAGVNDQALRRYMDNPDKFDFSGLIGFGG